MSSSTGVSQEGGVAGVPSWNRPLPEMLASFSTFLDPQDVSSLLMTSRHCAGAKKVIKKEFLHRNFDYLEKCVLTETEELFGPDMWVFSNSKIDDWMEANDDWKELYRDRSNLSERDVKIFKRYFGTVFGAIHLGRIDVVDFLIEHEGEDPNQEMHRSGGDTFRPLTFAVLSPNPSCLCYLLGREDIQKNFIMSPGSGRTFGLFVAMYGTVKALEICLRYGVDVNGREDDGLTVMHTLCWLTCNGVAEGTCGKSILPRMRLVLLHGANPNARDHSGDTPRDTIEWIREHDCRPTVTAHDFDNMIALLEEHEQGGLVGEGAV